VWLVAKRLASPVTRFVAFGSVAWLESAICSEASLRCNPPLFLHSDETTNRLPSLSLNIA
jgi:hypothetical protein